MSVDQIHTFAFDDVPIRGRVVTLTDAWQKIRSRQTYAPDPERVLGEMVAIVAMLAQGIKLDGSVILQMRGNGPIRTAMAECTDRTMLRATLRTANNSSDATEPTHAQRDGQLAITLKPHRGEMYQGIVPLDGKAVPLRAASAPPGAASVPRAGRPTSTLPSSCRHAYGRPRTLKALPVFCCSGCQTQTVRRWS